MTETKVCKKCRIEKFVSDFGKSGLRLLSDGTHKQYYKGICKKCVNVGPQSRKDNIDPKVCSTCGISKSLSEYAFEDNRYRAQCKACKYKQRVKFRSENPEVVERTNARNRYRWANETGYAEKQRETNRKSREIHGEKYLKKQREKYANDEEYRNTILQRNKDLWKNNEEYREKRKQKHLEYYKENYDKIRKQHREYYDINREIILQKDKIYRTENVEHCSKLRKAQYEKHQDKLVKEQKEYRTNRRLHLIERLGGKCVECGTTKSLQFDHINPLEKSFDISRKMTAPLEVLYPEIDKCQLLCSKCHIEKTKNDWLSGVLQEKRGY